MKYPVSCGAGWLGYTPDWEIMGNHQDNNNLYDEDIFWYLEPSASMELNVTRFFRIALGVSRRFTENLDLINTGPAELEKMNINLALKFGRF